MSFILVYCCSAHKNFLFNFQFYYQFLLIEHFSSLQMLLCSSINLYFRYSYVHTWKPVVACICRYYSFKQDLTFILVHTVFNQGKDIHLSIFFWTSEKILSWADCADGNLFLSTLFLFFFCVFFCILVLVLSSKNNLYIRHSVRCTRIDGFSTIKTYMIWQVFVTALPLIRYDQLAFFW